ncbi:hypothetical protein [Roseibium sp. RKSG952]|uniref:hypothetical protein n=1 Tax=Roseibium sp. RKSG952 TaxID=2529384 RepID=UPI0012BC40F9|nr:hypothetical protein [Roseibium sp. RKSG952]MTH94851.1 hypothetical protein [Roseibium sp. RKSG952]
MSAIWSKEDLHKLWLEEEPTAKSPYGLYGYPPMWRTLERTDGMSLFSRPAKVPVRINHQWEEVDGVSYQWQKDGEWWGQGHSAEFDTFFALLDRIEEDPLLRTGSIAITTRGSRWGSAALASGVLIVVEEMHPDLEFRRATVRDAMNVTRSYADIGELAPLPDGVDPLDYVREYLSAEWGTEKGAELFRKSLRKYKDLVREGRIPSLEDLHVYRRSPEIEPEDVTAFHRP